jgi:hypothetical protein
MDADTIIAHEIPQKPRSDTRRSWRAMRSVVVWLCSAAAGVVGFVTSNAEYGLGDSQAKITEFESSLTDCINAASQANFSKLGLVFNTSGFDPILAGATLVSDENGHPATADLIAAFKRLVGAFNGLNYTNRNCANRVLNQADAIYNHKHGSESDQYDSVSSLVPWEDVASTVGWQIIDPSQILMKCLGIAAASAVVAWIVAWLFVTGVALVWWFLIDRLRDIARAVRGD